MISNGTAVLGLSNVGAMDVIGRRDGVENLAAMHLLMLPRQTVFICDTYINEDPTATELADMAVLAAETVRRFGLAPRLALLSHSNFGSADTPSARKMRSAVALIRERAPGIEVDGEMHADAALSKRLLDRAMPDSELTAEANLLIAQSRRREHYLQRAEDHRGSRRYRRPDSARRSAACAYPDPGQYGPPVGQHDRVGGGCRQSVQTTIHDKEVARWPHLQ